MKYKNILRNHKEVYDHTVNVAELATEFAKFTEMFDVEEVEVIRKGTILHDIGKIFVPRSILYKEGRLDGNEYEIVKKHSQYGYNFLVTGNPLGEQADEQVQFDDGVREEAVELIKEFTGITDSMLSIVLQHHERIDGMGYPHGSKGDEIHSYAKLVSICDVFDAITSPRCYKPKYDYEYALECVQNGSGTQFDETLAKKFVSFIKKSWLPKQLKANN